MGRGGGRELWAAEAAWRLGFPVRWHVLSFRGPVAVGDTGLYYVLCDKGCLMADKALPWVGLVGRRSVSLGGERGYTEPLPSPKGPTGERVRKGNAFLFSPPSKTQARDDSPPYQPQGWLQIRTLPKFAFACEALAGFVQRAPYVHENTRLGNHGGWFAPAGRRVRKVRPG